MHPLPTLLLAAVAILPATLPAQLTPHALLAQAVAAQTEGKAALVRFTRFDLDHTQNRNEKGKLYFDKTTLYEDTWLGGLPYKRVVEVDGTPLTGRDLQHEQARYDQAVAERNGLDDAARARLVHIKSVDSSLHLPTLLTPDYRLAQLREEAIDGRTVQVIEATPIPSTDPLHPAATRRVELWIAQEDPTILRLTFEVLADEPEILRGSTGQQDFQLIDGIPVARHTATHAFFPNQGKTIAVETEHTYTRYRRFTASARILPTEPAPMP